MSYQKNMLIHLCILLTILVSCSNDENSLTPDPNNGGAGNSEGDVTVLENGLTIINGSNPSNLNLFTYLMFQELGLAENNFVVYQHGAFAIWWDSRFDIQSEIPALLVELDAIKNDLNQQGVGNLGAENIGLFTNIYIHRGDDDIFPSFFAKFSSKGSDKYAMQTPVFSSSPS
jgi:hypothetical protein